MESVDVSFTAMLTTLRFPLRARVALDILAGTTCLP
jgi:hypothetical protein